MRRRRALSVLLASVLVATGAAAGVNSAQLSWSDELVRRGLDPDRVVDPFVTTDEMRKFARAAARGADDNVGRLNNLQLALFSTTEFPFAYEPSVTLTAREAFEERRGNCLSFTVLFVALARSLDIDAQLLSVNRVISVDKDDDLVVVNRHVVAGYLDGGMLYIFDFQDDETTLLGQYEFIDARTASGMYHSNIGASMLRLGDVPSALEHLEMSVLLAPQFPGAWINLGVARMRMGNVDGALSAYQEALELDPGNSSALTNIAAVHTREGRPEAAHAALQAAAKGTESPFALVALADVELQRGDLDSALKHLKHARRLGRDVPEVWDALSRWARLSGNDRKEARFSDKAAKLRDRQHGDGTSGDGGLH
jgi:hypothetical protein